MRHCTVCLLALTLLCIGGVADADDDRPVTRAEFEQLRQQLNTAHARISELERERETREFESTSARLETLIELSEGMEAFAKSSADFYSGNGCHSEAQGFREQEAAWKKRKETFQNQLRSIRISFLIKIGVRAGLYGI